MNRTGDNPGARRKRPRADRARRSGHRPSTLAGAMVLGCVFMMTTAASAFRTASNLSQFGSTERVRWATNDLLFDVVDALPPGVSNLALMSEFSRAFGTWSAPACSGFRASFAGFAKAPAKFADGRNTIQFVSSGWAALGYSEDAAGATDLRYEKDAAGHWQIAEADIYVNADAFRWTSNAVASGEERTVFSVLLHEGGHALGLLHDCEEQRVADAPLCSESGIQPSDSVMYPVYDASQSALTSDDESGVCFLYQACEATGCPSGFECGASGCSQACATDTTDGACVEGEVCSRSGCMSTADCAAVDCLHQAKCELDSDCDAGSYCVDASCQTGKTPLGDSCSTSQQCSEGTCTKAGYCAPACDSNAPCLGEGEACEPAPDGKQACLGVRKAMGEPCAESNECLGGECLSGAHDAPVCTRRCDAENACPTSWNSAMSASLSWSAAGARSPATTRVSSLGFSQASQALWGLFVFACVAAALYSSAPAAASRARFTPR